MGTFTYSPLAEGLATIGGYYDSPSSHVVSYYCQKNFVIVVSPGVSSMDTHPANQYLPQTFEDFDGDDGGIGEGKIKANADIYDIPKENVIGTAIQTDFISEQGKSYLKRFPMIVPPIDDKQGKPVNLHRFSGRRPILAFGNSDGDIQMLQYTDDREGPALCLLLHHDDAEREWAYDQESKVGHLDKGLDEAKSRGWTVVSMKNDFKKVFPSD